MSEINFDSMSKPCRSNFNTFKHLEAQILDNCTNISPRLRAEITRLLTPGAEPPAGSLTTSVCNQWYRTMAVRFHPDKGGSHEAMKAVNAGRELLLQLAGGDAA